MFGEFVGEAPMEIDEEFNYQDPEPLDENLKQLPSLDLSHIGSTLGSCSPTMVPSSPSFASSPTAEDRSRSNTPAGRHSSLRPSARNKGSPYARRTTPASSRATSVQRSTTTATLSLPSSSNVTPFPSPLRTSSTFRVVSECEELAPSTADTNPNSTPGAPVDAEGSGSNGNGHNSVSPGLLRFFNDGRTPPPGWRPDGNGGQGWGGGGGGPGGGRGGGGGGNPEMRINSYFKYDVQRHGHEQTESLRPRRLSVHSILLLWRP
ncbi:hypothetical protein NMY22_g18967 [Coprinellus aureogranulatus]|nr:hypothetical protein NMY22_g18967 [Coprinellus aureogranulatus]